MARRGVVPIVVAIVVVAILVPYLALLAEGASEIAGGKRLFGEVPWDRRSALLLGTSLLLSLLTGLVACILAFIFLIALWNVRSRWFRVGTVLVFGTAFCVPSIVHLLGWRNLPFYSDWSPLAATIALLGWKYFPLVALILVVSLLGLDGPHVEAGRLFGSWTRSIRHLVMPRIRPGIGVAFATVFVLTFAEAETPPLLGMRVYAEEFMSRVALGDSMTTTLVAGIPFVLVAVATAIGLASYWPRETAYSWRRSGLQALDRATNASGPARAGSIVLCALLASPLALLAMSAHRGWGQHVNESFAALATSAGLGMGTALLATTIGYVLAELLFRLGPSSRFVLIAVLALPVFLPGSLTGLGMLSIGQTAWGEWLSHGNTLLLATHTLRLTPLAALLLTALRLVEPRSLRAEAGLFSGSWWRIERRIVFPSARPRLMLVFGLVFSLALAELSSTILTVSPGTETLVLRVYNLLHFGALPSVAALALLQSTVTAAVMLLAYAAARRVFRAAD